MNEINVNAFSRPAGIEKPQNSAANQQSASSRKALSGEDSVQFSEFPDLSKVEQSLEHEFTALRTGLEGEVSSSGYPPVETIDRLAAMLAAKLAPTRGDSVK